MLCCEGEKNQQVKQWLRRRKKAQIHSSVIAAYCLFWGVYWGSLSPKCFSVGCRTWDMWTDLCYLLFIGILIPSVVISSFPQSMWDVSVNPFGISVLFFLSLFQAFYHSSKQNRNERCWTEQRKISHTTEIQCYPVLKSKISPLCPPACRPAFFFFSAACFHWRLKHLHLN